MDRPLKKRKKVRVARGYKGEDRISMLTDDVIHQILKFVDTKLAVQTSVLSKRWKLVWTTLPFLKFNSEECGSPKNATYFTLHVLNKRNHQSQISNLELAYLPPGLNDKFIGYAISHHVQHLSVRFREKHKPYKLSNFSSNLIRNLELRMKLEDLVSESDCWDLPSLATLHLIYRNAGSVYQILPLRCLTCLPSLRTLHFSLWNFQESPLYLSLPDLTTLHLSTCQMPKNIWNLPALKTLRLYNVNFPGNMIDTLAALVGLENLALHLLHLNDYFIPGPHLVNLEIETQIGYYDTMKGNIVVLAPKLSTFTAVGIFSITFEASKLDNVYIKLRGWMDHNCLPMQYKEIFRRYTYMLPGLGSAKILNLDLDTIKVLSLVSDFLVSSPSPFYNLKYVKLPYGFKESSLSCSLKSYLLGGSPTATIMTTSRQNMISHKAAAPVTAQNVVTEEILAASTMLVSSDDI